ncbi:hypothetical protein B0533_01390 [Sedimentibacter sp. SX930]|nr:hypothetical protein B0533_01390 [Sedimentibacter sp. SX930]
MLNFEAMLLSQIDMLETEPEIIKLAQQLRTIPMFSNLAEEEYERALNVAVKSLRESFGQSYVVESDEKHVPWFEAYYKDLGVTRWDRYVDYLRNQKKFAPAVVTGMQKNLFKITDLLGDPNGMNFKRKGLIIGDVQSGKTANYVGLMNLATDARYKLIVVLTGTTNTLREQTQIRIEEGLGKAKLSKGVSTIQNTNYKEFSHKNPVYLTSKQSDFDTNSRKNIQQSIETTNVPIVIVTKKNSTALQNIYEWLDNYSKKNPHDDHIDSSILLIDDEADFASVNTMKEDKEKPTSINKKIREILELFTKSSYIGFTATPYANIFINPDNETKMYGQDLFPRDYIYVLGESEEYIGVQSVFGKDAKHSNMLVPLNPSNVENYLILKHKKEDLFTSLAPSMIDALNLFFMANVIRDLRGDLTKHRSMLMNISRFTMMHDKIKSVVLEYVIQVQKDVRLHGKLPLEEALNIPTIAAMKKSYDEHYSTLQDGVSFEKLLKGMNDSIYRIQVAIVNKDNKELDYLLNEDEGERVIVIGGFALSRGLTLEGLMISYYFRNSVMYDSLLQMGRWFGYRPNYADLCKVYMTQDVISDFKFIAMATEELKDDLEINSKRGLTPKEFGIKVRSGQTGLIITSRNKMRTGKQITARIDFSKDIVETTALTIANDEINKQNHKIIEKLIDKHKGSISDNLDPNPKNISRGLIDLEKVDIIQFLKDYTPAPGSKFDSQLIIKWLRSNTSEILDNWDMAFVTGSENEIFDYGNGIKGTASKRTMIAAKDLEGVYKNSNSRLGSPTDGRYGLNESQFEKVKSTYGGKGETIAQKKYFESEFKHKPIIIVYSVVPIDGDNRTISSEYIPLLSLGIPELGFGKSRYVDYRVNKVYQDIEDLEVEEE